MITLCTSIDLVNFGWEKERERWIQINWNKFHWEKVKYWTINDTVDVFIENIHSLCHAEVSLIIDFTEFQSIVKRLINWKACKGLPMISSSVMCFVRNSGRPAEAVNSSTYLFRRWWWRRRRKDKCKRNYLRTHVSTNCGFVCRMKKKKEEEKKR